MRCVYTARWLTWGALACALAVAQPVRAQRPTEPPSDVTPGSARESFTRGETAYRAGDYLMAAKSFHRAYVLAPHMAAVWNEARSWERAREIAKAATAYRAYLEMAPADAADRDSATRSMADISVHVARVDLSVEADLWVTVDEDPDVLMWKTVYLAEGPHRIRGRDLAGVIRAEYTVDLRAGGERALRIDSEKPSVSALPTPTAVTTALPPPLVPSVEPPPLNRVQDAPTDDPKGLRVLPPWTLVPLSVVALGSFGLMGISGAATLSAQGRYLDSRSRTDYETGHTLQDRTNLLLGMGIGFTVVTALAAVFFTDWSKSPAATKRALAKRADVAGGRR